MPMHQEDRCVVVYPAERIEWINLQIAMDTALVGLRISCLKNGLPNDECKLSSAPTSHALALLKQK